MEKWVRHLYVCSTWLHISTHYSFGCKDNPSININNKKENKHCLFNFMILRGRQLCGSDCRRYTRLKHSKECLVHVVFHSIKQINTRRCGNKLTPYITTIYWELGQTIACSADVCVHPVRSPSELHITSQSCLQANSSLLI